MKKFFVLGILLGSAQLFANSHVSIVRGLSDVPFGCGPIKSFAKQLSLVACVQDRDQVGRCSTRIIDSSKGGIKCTAKAGSEVNQLQQQEVLKVFTLTESEYSYFPGGCAPARSIVRAKLKDQCLQECESKCLEVQTESATVSTDIGFGDVRKNDEILVNPITDFSNDLSCLVSSKFVCVEN